MNEDILTRPTKNFTKRELKWAGLISLILIASLSVGLNLKSFVENQRNKLRNEGRDILYAEILDSIAKYQRYIIVGKNEQGQERYLILVPKVATTSEEK